MYTLDIAFFHNTFFASSKLLFRIMLKVKVIDFGHKKLAIILTKAPAALHMMRKSDILDPIIVKNNDTVSSKYTTYLC